MLKDRNLNKWRYLKFILIRILIIAFIFYILIYLWQYLDVLTQHYLLN